MGGLEKTKEYLEILLNSNVLCKSWSEEFLLKSAKNKLELLLGFLNENIGKDSSNGKIKK